MSYSRNLELKKRLEVWENGVGTQADRQVFELKICACIAKHTHKETAVMVCDRVNDVVRKFQLQNKTIGIFYFVPSLIKK